MSRAVISAALRQAVAEASRYRCAYCQTSERIAGAEHTIDHIIPESLGGSTTPDNLCLACWRCNLIKRDRITAIDPQSGYSVRLFHPNRQIWHDHFAWQEHGLLVAGLTPTGRATVNALRLNRASLVRSRQLWIEAGWHPPQA
ncbi:MAG TPA: HNH endonuclease [Anaerolineae bacterium]|nr:HNH endonuclease [Anaerolineae bacterium]